MADHKMTKKNDKECRIVHASRMLPKAVCIMLYSLQGKAHRLSIPQARDSNAPPKTDDYRGDITKLRRPLCFVEFELLKTSRLILSDEGISSSKHLFCSGLRDFSHHDVKMGSIHISS